MVFSHLWSKTRVTAGACSLHSTLWLIRHRTKEHVYQICRWYQSGCKGPQEERLQLLWSGPCQDERWQVIFNFDRCQKQWWFRLRTIGARGLYMLHRKNRALANRTDLKSRKHCKLVYKKVNTILGFIAKNFDSMSATGNHVNILQLVGETPLQEVPPATKPLYTSKELTKERLNAIIQTPEQDKQHTPCHYLSSIPTRESQLSVSCLTIGGALQT